MTSRRWVVLLAILLTSLSCGSVALASAQELAQVDRGPRFLRRVAGAAKPVAVDLNATRVLRRRVALPRDGATLGELLSSIQRQTGLKFIYSTDVIPVERVVGLRADSITVAAALTELLVDAGVDVVFYSAREAGLVRRWDRVVQTGVVVGRVTDAKSGEGLGGVEVQLEDTRWRVNTGDDGRYRLADVEVGSYTLTVRRLGYAKQSRAVTVAAEQEDTVDVALEPTVRRLDELVTTVTGPQRRMELANAVTVLAVDSIVRNQPIKDVTDLLQTRAAGLAVLPTTGAPGDPARLRLRGSSSITRSNDPIVVVDGVRIYAEQSNARNASLGWSFVADASSPDNGLSAVPAPSPLDRIDPNSIETIEVLNGPSASTLYGADAANGVIVITTKRGRPGPAKWDVALTHGRSSTPGRFPDIYVRLPSRFDLSRPDCSVSRLGATPGCYVDSIGAYQVLNDPELTVLGQGHSSSASVGVSGGRSDITYAIFGMYSDELGLLKLPSYEVDRFRETFGRAPDDWMERPHRLTRWSISSGLDFRPANTATVGFTMSLAGDEQRRSSLEQQLQALRNTYVDKMTERIYSVNNGFTGDPQSTLVPDFYRKTTNRAMALKTGVTVNWRPLDRLTLRANAGVSADLRRDESLLPRGLRLLIYETDPNPSPDTAGFFAGGQGTVAIRTLDVGANYTAPLRLGFRVDASVGFNATSQSITDMAQFVRDPSGVASTDGTLASTQYRDDLTSYGWYIEPRISNERLFLSTGLRLDGGSNYGAGVSGFALPKLGFSWLISDEPFFPLKDSRLLNMLRLRAAYGKAGVQPGPGDRLRLFSGGDLATIGNTQLRPERSTEIEWGADADLFDGRVSVGVSGYRKTKDDALLSVNLPPSVVGTETVLINIGVVRNTGFELTLQTNLLRTERISWGTHFVVSHNRNVVVALADGLEAFGIGGTTSQRVAVGYPLFGYWQRPVLSYADANGDRILQESEIVLGDSLAYRGVPEPARTAAVHTDIGLFRGALTLSASFDYQDGATQQNQTPGGVVARAAATDPSKTPLDQQMLVFASDPTVTSGTAAGLLQEVSTLRFHSLSIGWQLPVAVIRWVGAQRGSVALQATNLGLITNYRGKDPLVNSIATGNGVVDAGALPQPREWRARVSFSY